MSNKVKSKQNKQPKWLRVKLPSGESYREVRRLVDQHKLHTICESGSCPNMGECWGEGTATFYDFGKYLYEGLVDFVLSKQEGRMPLT